MQQNVQTKHGIGTIVSFDTTTYSITIYVIRLADGTTIALTESEFIRI